MILKIKQISCSNDFISQELNCVFKTFPDFTSVVFYCAMCFRTCVIIALHNSLTFTALSNFLSIIILLCTAIYMLLLPLLCATPFRTWVVMALHNFTSPIEKFTPQACLSREYWHDICISRRDYLTPDEVQFQGLMIQRSCEKNSFKQRLLSRLK